MAFKSLFVIKLYNKFKPMTIPIQYDVYTYLNRRQLPILLYFAGFNFQRYNMHHTILLFYSFTSPEEVPASISFINWEKHII